MKEKAQELWMKYFQKQIDVSGNGDGELAYQCALICVEEKVETIKNLPISDQMKHTEVEYLEALKQEIEKL